MSVDPPSPQTTLPELAPKDRIIFGYMLDALKYLCSGDHDTARRSLDHAQSHFDERYLGQMKRIPDPWERGGLAEGKADDR